MSFGIAKDIKSEVRVCTPELLNQALDSELVARTCAEIEDALDNLYKTCVHAIDSLRSLLSYTKEDMRLSRSGN